MGLAGLFGAKMISSTALIALRTTLHAAGLWMAAFMIAARLAQTLAVRIHTPACLGRASQTALARCAATAAALVQVTFAEHVLRALFAKTAFA